MDKCWRDIAGRGECDAGVPRCCIKFQPDQWGKMLCPPHTLASGPSFPQCDLSRFMELGVSRGKSSADPRKHRAGPLRAESEACTARRPREGRGPWRPRSLERKGPASTSTGRQGGRSRTLRPTSASSLKYYPGVFNYLFLMDLQGLFHQVRGGWVWGCGERAARAGAGKMAHISILKPFTIVSSMKDAANKMEPPAPASPSPKF